MTVYLSLTFSIGKVNGLAAVTLLPNRNCDAAGAAAGSLMPTLASENLKLSSCANGEQDSENAVSPFVHTALVKLLDDHHHHGSFSDSPLGKQVVPTPHNDDHSWPINISATLMLTNG